MSNNTIRILCIWESGEQCSIPMARTMAATELRVSLKREARRLICEKVRTDHVGTFRLIGRYTAPGEEDHGNLRIYGFLRGSGKPNTHELPPEITGKSEPLLFGPILVVRVQPDTQNTVCLRSIDSEQYALFRRRAFMEETLHTSDSERSTDGSDNGSSLDDFIVSDDCME